MKGHRVHTQRIRFVVSGNEWEVLSRKSKSSKSGENAPKIPRSPNQRAEVASLCSWDQGVNKNG